MFSRSVLFSFSFVLIVILVHCQDGQSATQVYTQTTNNTNIGPPRNFTYEEKGEGNIKFTWLEPENTTNVTAYALFYVDHYGKPTTVIVDGTERQHFGIGFQAWTNYTFYLFAFVVYPLQGSNPAELKIRTKMRAPSQPGIIVDSIDRGITSISLRWTEPKSKNGVLSGYKVNHHSVKDGSDNTTYLTNDTFREISPLNPYTEYKISVTAFNEEDGVELLSPADTAKITTRIGTPSQVRNLTAENVTKTGFNVSWAKPETPNGPEPHYKVTLKGRGVNIPKDVQVTRVEYSALFTGSVYSISVRACNHDNELMCSNETEITVATHNDVPSEVQNLTVAKNSSTSVSIKWKKPATPNGPITGFSISHRMESGIPETTTTTDLFHELTNLRPWKFYTISVSAFNVDSENSSVLLMSEMSIVNATTLASSPSAVEELKLGNISSSSIEVKWSSPSVPNGPISGYIVCQEKECQNTTSESFNVSNLNPGKKYVIEVSAYNLDTVDPSVVLEGNKTAVTGETLAKPPSAVSELKLGIISSSSIEVKWSSPSIPNGPISGYIVCQGKDCQNTTSESFTVSNLNPGKEYVIEVSAFNLDTVDPSVVLEGDKTAVTGQTLAKPPPKPKALNLIGFSRTTIDFNFTKPLFSSSNGGLKDYVLLVAAGDTIGMSGGVGEDTKLDFKAWNETKNKEIYRSSPTGWSPETENEVCKTKNGVLSCTVGAQTNCSKERFCNAALQPKTKYRFKIRGYTAAGWSETDAIEATTAGGKVLAATIGLMGLPLLVISSKYL